MTLRCERRRQKDFSASDESQYPITALASRSISFLASAMLARTRSPRNGHVDFLAARQKFLKCASPAGRPASHDAARRVISDLMPKREAGGHLISPTDRAEAMKCRAIRRRFVI